MIRENQWSPLVQWGQLLMLAAVLATLLLQQDPGSDRTHDDAQQATSTTRKVRS